MIHVDTRERAPMRLLAAAAVNGDTNEHVLGSADFLIFEASGHSLGIERKEAADLLKSLTVTQKNGEKHLLDQLRRMREDYDHQLLIVEGIPSYNSATHMLGRSKWHHGAVQMILWAIEADGTPILYTDNMRATADLLRILNQRALRGCVLPSRTAT